MTNNRKVLTGQELQMPANTFGTLEMLTSKSGPFTDYAIDEMVLGEILAWIDGEPDGSHYTNGNGDWQRLRLLLNYVFERGERRGVEITIRQANEVLHGIAYREKTVWESKLLNKPAESEAVE